MDEETLSFVRNFSGSYEIRHSTVRKHPSRRFCFLAKNRSPECREAFFQAAKLIPSINTFANEDAPAIYLPRAPPHKMIIQIVERRKLSTRARSRDAECPFTLVPACVNLTYRARYLRYVIRTIRHSPESSVARSILSRRKQKLPKHRIAIFGTRILEIQIAPKARAFPGFFIIRSL